MKFLDETGVTPEFGIYDEHKVSFTLNYLLDFLIIICHWFLRDTDFCG